MDAESITTEILGYQSGEHTNVNQFLNLKKYLTSVIQSTLNICRHKQILNQHLLKKFNLKRGCLCYEAISMQGPENYAIHHK